MLVKALFVLVIGIEFAAASGLRVVRPLSDDVEWVKEMNAIEKDCQDNEKDQPVSKIVPLFIAVKLNLGEPVSEYGAVVREYAYVYSEVKNKSGEIVRRIAVLGRSPYEDRRWRKLEVFVEGHTTRQFFGLAAI